MKNVLPLNAVLNQWFENNGQGRSGSEITETFYNSALLEASYEPSIEDELVVERLRLKLKHPREGYAEWRVSVRSQTDDLSVTQVSAAERFSGNLVKLIGKKSKSEGEVSVLHAFLDLYERISPTPAKETLRTSRQTRALNGDAPQALYSIVENFFQLVEYAKTQVCDNLDASLN